MQIENFNDIVCIEGNAGSGKTTCCVNFSDEKDTCYLREYTETLDPVHRKYLNGMRTRHGKNDESAIWRCAELRRAKACKAARSKQVFLDTSLISVIAFELASRKFALAGDLSAIVREYQVLLSDKQLVLPGKFIHLYVSEEVRQVRLRKRGHCHPFLLRSDVSQFIDNIRLQFFEMYLPPSCWAQINSSALTPTEVKRHVGEVLPKLSAISMERNILNWLSGRV